MFNLFKIKKRSIKSKKNISDNIVEDLIMTKDEFPADAFERKLIEYLIDIEDAYNDLKRTDVYSCEKVIMNNFDISLFMKDKFTSVGFSKEFVIIDKDGDIKLYIDFDCIDEEHMKELKFKEISVVLNSKKIHHLISGAIKKVRDEADSIKYKRTIEEMYLKYDVILNILKSLKKEIEEVRNIEVLKGTKERLEEINRINELYGGVNKP